MTMVGTWILTACGAALVFIGGYFLLLRPPLLAEDLRFMDSTVDRVTSTVPALSRWLRHVFWVMGGYIVTTGLLVAYVASTGVREGNTGALGVVAVAGVGSVGWMSAVNFMIRSDFRWILLALDGIWVVGLLMAGTAR